MFFSNQFEQPGPAASTQRLWLEIEESYSGFPLRLPYIHFRGAAKGPRMVIVSGVHGDELNGIQIIHHLADLVDPSRLNGQLILLPIANVSAFHLQSRYLPDRRDLNRLFPGKSDGSEGSRLASLIWESFVVGADFGIDLHSASYDRWNYPHIRGNMKEKEVRRLATAFGAKIIINSDGMLGSLRRAANKQGIPFILFEAGQINRFETEFVDPGVAGIWGVMLYRKMVNYWPKGIARPEASTSYYRKTYWIRADTGGLFSPLCRPGDHIQEGDCVGHITSLLGEKQSEVLAPTEGRVLGYNLHPQVAPGRALYHIGSQEKLF